MAKKIQTEDQTLDLVKLIPNMLTLTALCVGLTSVRFALGGHFKLAIIAIVIACFLDALDGKMARMLNASSGFGAQMDSLADFFNFGIGPAFIVYFWRMNEVGIKGIAWLAVLLSAICMAIRLARFNMSLVEKDQNHPLIKYFFEGVPAPIIAGWITFPMILYFQFGEGFYSNPLFITINCIIVSLLGASTIPTFSFKKMKIKKEYSYLVLMIFAIFIAGLVIKPWLTLSIMGFIYIIMIPTSILTYFKIKNNLKK